jgi:transcriptional regulator with XRE-family HTH domain
MNKKKDMKLGKAVGKALKILRTAKGMKQSDLAKKTEVQTNYISMIENGHREPSLSFLEAAASALNAPIDLFFIFARDTSEISKGSSENYDRLQQILLQLIKSSHKASR